MKNLIILFPIAFIIAGIKLVIEVPSEWTSWFFLSMSIVVTATLGYLLYKDSED